MRLIEFIANHLFLFTLLTAIIAFLLWDIFGHAMRGVSNLPPADITRLINRENAKVFDLRTASEFAGGHIIAAKNIEATVLGDTVKRLGAEQPIILCCANGGVSLKQASQIKSNAKIHCLKGGILAWQQANLPLTKE